VTCLLNVHASSGSHSHARHSGERRNPVSFVSCSSDSTSFPRKRESISLFYSDATAPASARLRRAGHFLCLCKESSQRNTPRKARPPGLLPCGCAKALRGSLNVRPCTCSERARVVRAPLRAFPPHLRRALRGPGGGGILPQKPEYFGVSDSSRQYRDVRIRGQRAVRGAEHRSRHRNSPKGRGEGSPRWRSSTGMYCLSHPVMARSAGHPAALTRGGAPRPALDLFWLLFWGNAKKVTRSAEGRAKALLPQRRSETARRWIPAFAGMTNRLTPGGASLCAG